jgi:hypothetical protein
MTVLILVNEAREAPPHDGCHGQDRDHRRRGLRHRHGVRAAARRARHRALGARVELAPGIAAGADLGVALDGVLSRGAPLDAAIGAMLGSAPH